MRALRVTRAMPNLYPTSRYTFAGLLLSALQTPLCCVLWGRPSSQAGGGGGTSFFTTPHPIYWKEKERLGGGGRSIPQDLPAHPSIRTCGGSPSWWNIRLCTSRWTVPVTANVAKKKGPSTGISGNMCEIRGSYGIEDDDVGLLGGLVGSTNVRRNILSPSSSGLPTYQPRSPTSTFQ